jgi:nucleotide-binding universal stress UspA family protein
MYDTILVPTDGSDHARRAAAHALAFARAFDAAVHVVGVADVQSAAGLFAAGGVDAAFVERIEAECERWVAATGESLAGAPSVRTAVVRGHPAEAILEYVDEHGVELVAMGTHGRTGIGRFVAGSVTESVVRRARVPVLTARLTDRPSGDGYDDVLVPTDGSAAAGRAVDHGLAVARAFDATVHAVNVVDAGSLSVTADDSVPTEVIEALRDAGRRAAEDVADRARAAGLDAVAAVRDGSPARGLLDYVDEHGVDLVAMATAGRTGPSRYLLGSTTERVVRHATVPVLAVDARDREDGD